MTRHTLFKRLWYDGLRLLCRIAAVVLFRIRCRGRHHVPPTGGVLLLSNHQSHFDPVLVGLACNRRLNYLARHDLFDFPPLGWLIRSLDAIEINRDGLGLAGLKETLRRLKRHEVVLIFPEGTRSRDGKLGPLKPGFCALARRTRAHIVPVAIDGAFDAWPRTRRWPVTARIEVQFGPALAPEEVAAYGDRDLVLELEARIQACHRLAAQRRRR